MSEGQKDESTDTTTNVGWVIDTSSSLDKTSLDGTIKMEEGVATLDESTSDATGPIQKQPIGKGEKYSYRRIPYMLRR